MRKFTLALAAGTMIVTLSTPARAIWAPVPLEVLVDQAELIVAGKVVRVEPAGFALNNRPQDAAVVEVTTILKALPHAGRPKQVRIAQPAARGLALSTDLAFSAGQAGIWLLSRVPGQDAWQVTHPSQFQGAESQKQLTELVAAREKLAGGAEAKGLVARAEVVTTIPAARPGAGKPATFYELRFSLKNTSDRPITVCDYAGRRPLTVRWIGPDGAERKSSHYDWLARAFLPPLGAMHFPTIPPGGVIFVGPQSSSYGIFFQTDPAAAARGQVAEPGTHRITVSYQNVADRKAQGAADAWTGTVAANEVQIDVK